MADIPRAFLEEIVPCSACEQDEAYLIPGEAQQCQTCGAWIRYGVA